MSGAELPGPGGCGGKIRCTARPAGGFTLVEVLTALALLAVVVLAVGYFTVGSARTWRAALQLLERAQFTAVAGEVVLQELALAGYGLEPSDPPLATVEISLNPHPDRSDSVRVHYREDRWLAAPQLQDITIDVTGDAQGNRNLYRREHGATRQPAVQGVTNLKLFRFISSDGQLLDPLAAWPQRVSGLVLLLSFEWDAQQFVIVQFGTPQLLAAL